MTLVALGLASFVFVVLFTIRTYYAGDNPRQAIIEAWVNIVIGFTINVIANFALFPLMVDAQITLSSSFWGGWIYTAISVLRQYAIRRWFQERIHVLAARLTT